MDTFIVVMTLVAVGEGWVLYREIRQFLGLDPGTDYKESGDRSA